VLKTPCPKSKSRESFWGIAACGDYDDYLALFFDCQHTIRFAATRKEEVAVSKREAKSCGVHVSVDSSLGFSVKSRKLEKLIRK
jgi:hypothetical protein